MKQVDFVFSFDIDGTLTALADTTPNPVLLTFIATQLSQKIPTALITGRGYGWIEQYILPPLVAKVQDLHDLDYLYISSELATVQVTFKEGIVDKQIKPLAVPHGVKQALHGLAEEAPGVFYDPTKTNFSSIEIEGGTKEQVKRQKSTLAQLKPIIQDKILAHHPDFVVLDTPVIALDIQHKNANKYDSAKEFLSFIKLKNVLAKHIIHLGDAVSDGHLAEKFAELRNDVLFGYTGTKELPDLQVKVLQPTHGELYDQATLDILHQLKVLSLT